MSVPLSPLPLLAVCIASGLLAGCATAPDAANGGAPSVASRGSAPIYVTDFHLDVDRIKKKGVLGQEQIGPLRNRIGLLSLDDPASRPGELIALLSATIVEELQKEGFKAARVGGIRAELLPDGRIQTFAPELPRAGWLVAGRITDLEQGNAAVEAAVGLGVDAGEAQAEVAVGDLAGDPSLPTVYMGSSNHARRMPGGLATMNPYVIAAKFVIDKRHGTERDVKSLGKQIARGLAEYFQGAPAGR